MPEPCRYIYTRMTIMSETEQREKAPILSVKLALTDYDTLLESVQNAIAHKQHIRLNFCNVHVTMLAQNSAPLMAALNHPDALTLPDGMPLVWALRSCGYLLRDRVYGPDFFELCLSSQRGTTRHYFFGSTDDTLTKLRQKLTTRFPGILIAGMYSPPFRPLTPEEEADIINNINESNADIVWVGLGAPKQELWINATAGRIHAPVVAAVGAAFDFLAGTVRQAPDWMQRFGLEWLFRLIMEPRRLWFRYLYYNPLFVLKFLHSRYFTRR